MQIKSFTAWVNLHLEKVGEKVSDLTSDFDDGVKLLKLIEVISEEDLGKYNKTPISVFQKVENLNRPLKYINSFLLEQGIRNTYSAENIMDGDARLILGMVYSLILRFNIAQISEGDLTAKEGLLLWANNKISEVSGGKHSVNNFHTSWQDGIAFHALIQAFKKDYTDHAALDLKKRETNLKQAFVIAKEKIGIPQLLDAADMVSARPDEKSVMTYISFFWKAFAETKRKRMAGDRIAKAVKREQSYADMQAQYKAGSEKLLSWVQSKIKALAEAQGQPVSSQAELDEALKAHQAYFRSEKPSKQQDLLDLEALSASVASRLSTLNRTFSPPEHIAVPALQRWWEKLSEAEKTFEASLSELLCQMKRVELYVKLFDSKAGKLEDWLFDKTVWLDDSSARISRHSAVAPSDPSADASAGKTSFFDSILSAVIPKQDKHKTPQQAQTLPSGAREKPPSGSGEDQFPPTTPAQGLKTPGGLALSMKAVGHTGGGAMSWRRVGDTLERHGAGGLQGQKETPRKGAMGDAPMDSVSAVQAKLNMFAAYEEELAGRQDTLPELEALLQKIVDVGCAQERLQALAERIAGIEDRFSAIRSAGERYLRVLRAELEKQHSLEKMRVEFAKRAEAINRYTESALDMLTEVLALDSVTEAEVQLEELASFRTSSHSQQEAELREMQALHERMLEAGVLSNPYSRFNLMALEMMVGHVEHEIERRQHRLEEAKEHQRQLEVQKREFAAAAEAALAFILKEKEALVARVAAVRIHPDDADSLAGGFKLLADLEAQMSPEARAERAERLSKANQIHDALIEQAELDNPFTRQTTTSLQSQMEQLEKVIRDKHLFVEGQLARAQANVTAEQMEEIRAAFLHFDKNQNGELNRHEFAAALRSLDTAISAEEETAAFARLATPAKNPPPEEEAASSEALKGSRVAKLKSGSPRNFQRSGSGVRGEAKADGPPLAVGLEAFSTLVLQQYKEKDTFDDLLAAFKVVSGAQEAVDEETLRNFLPEAEAGYLVPRLAPHKAGGGLDYTPFAESVYGCN